MLYLLIAGILVILILLIYLVISSGRKSDNTSNLMLQQQIDSLRQQVTESIMTSTQRIDQLIANVTSQVNQQMSSITQQLQMTSRDFGSRLDSASKTFADVKEGLGEISEANKRVFEIAKDIAELQNLLKPSKIRGSIGEVLLQNLLEDILPGKFISQHRFKDGTLVDFVIQLKDRLVPVDSKFPVEDFRRLVDAKSDDEKKKLKKEFMNQIKKHIDSIGQKYIKPNENTLNFAMMYIPAENIYYETIIREENSEDELFKYAMGKRVIPVSPNTFLAYLLTIVMGFRGMEIEQNAKIVLDALSELQLKLNAFKGEFNTLGSHLRNAMNKYDESQKKFSSIHEGVIGLTKIGALPSGEK